MSVLAILLALLLEQARPSLPLVRLRALHGRWLDFVARNLNAGDTHHAWVVWSLGVVLPALAVAAVHWALSQFSLILVLCWHVVVLYFTLGFRQFSHHFTAIRDALEQADETRARQLLAQWQGIDASELPRTELLRQVIEYGIVASHRFVFGVMFSYAVLAALGLGPAGAVLHRLARGAREHWSRRHPVDGEPSHPNAMAASQRAWRLIDHVPARLSAFGFAIVGNFEESIAAWRRDAGLWPDPNDGVLLAAAAGALGVQLGQVPVRAPVQALGMAVGAAAGVRAADPLGPEHVVVDALPDPALMDGSADEAVTAAGLTAGLPPQPGHLQSLVGLVWRSTILWVMLLALLWVANIIG